jgi:hypothetical protein
MLSAKEIKMSRSNNHWVIKNVKTFTLKNPLHSVLSTQHSL